MLTVGPRLSTRSLWGYVADFVAEEEAAGGSPSGVVLDIIKAFNVMRRRRPLVTAGMLHFGLPSNIVLAWMKALDGMERQILVAGCVYPAAEDLKKSTAGVPEGDPLSVVAMFCMCLFFARFVLGEADVVPVTYADNWQVIARQVGPIVTLFCRRFTSSSSSALYLFRLRSAGCGVLVKLGANGSNRLRLGILISRYGYRQLTLGLIYLTAKDVPQ